MSVSSAKASRAAFLYNSRQNVNRVTNISGPVPKKYRHLSKRLGTTVGTTLGNRLGPDLGLPFLLDLQILGAHGSAAMEKTIRVLVANRPRLMRELILAVFADQPDIEIVGEATHDSEIPATVERTKPDFLVIALDDPSERPAVCDAVLQLYPEMRIIAVAPNQNYSVHYWASLDIHSNEIEASEEGILSAVRCGTRVLRRRQSGDVHENA